MKQLPKLWSKYPKLTKLITATRKCHTRTRKILQKKKKKKKLWNVFVDSLCIMSIVVDSVQFAVFFSFSVGNHAISIETFGCLNSDV